MRLGSAESPSPRWHWKHGGSSSSGVNGLTVENSGDTWMWVLGVTLYMRASEAWKRHVSELHSTRYAVVRLGLVL